MTDLRWIQTVLRSEENQRKLEAMLRGVAGRAPIIGGVIVLPFWALAAYRCPSITLPWGTAACVLLGTAITFQLSALLFRYSPQQSQIAVKATTRGVKFGSRVRSWRTFSGFHVASEGGRAALMLHPEVGDALTLVPPDSETFDGLHGLVASHLSCELGNRSRAIELKPRTGNAIYVAIWCAGVAAGYSIYELSQNAGVHELWVYLILLVGPGNLFISDLRAGGLRGRVLLSVVMNINAGSLLLAHRLVLPLLQMRCLQAT